MVNLFFSKMHFGANVADFSDEELKRFGLALRCILSADRLSASELATYEEIARQLGASSELLEELDATDPATIDLDGLLEGLGDDFTTRSLLYNAIVIASTDGYAEKERAKTASAAEILGISDEVLKSLERLVDMESSQRRLKAALLKVR